jgi:hypothetical protein
MTSTASSATATCRTWIDFRSPIAAPATNLLAGRPALVVAVFQLNLLQPSAV